jgi:hypothetical protein
MPCVLTTNDSLGSAGVTAVLLACNFKVETRQGSSLRCEVNEKVVLSEPLAIARWLVRGSGRIELLGRGPAESAKVEELLAVFQDIALAGSVEESILTRLNDTLQTSTCLAGHNITIADVMLFHALRTSVVKLVQGPCDHLCHLVRWFDYVQNLDCVGVVPIPIRSYGVFDILGFTIEPQQEKKVRPKKEEVEKASSGTKQKGEKNERNREQSLPKSRTRNNTSRTR